MTADVATGPDTMHARCTAPHGGREERCCGQADRPVMSVVTGKELPCPARQHPGRNATAGRTAAPRSQQPEAGITASRSGASPAQVYDGYMTGAWPGLALACYEIRPSWRARLTASVRLAAPSLPSR